MATNPVGLPPLLPSRASLVAPMLERAAICLRDAGLILGPEPTLDEGKYVDAAAAIEKQVRALIASTGYDPQYWQRGRKLGAG
jgi:hypothetical protein